MVGVIIPCLLPDSDSSCGTIFLCGVALHLGNRDTFASKIVNFVPHKASEVCGCSARIHAPLLSPLVALHDPLVVDPHRERRQGVSEHLQQ